MNKKKLFSSTAVITIAAIAAFNVNFNTNEKGLSNVSLENVEALANENATGTGYACWQTLSAEVGSTLLYEKTYCITCTATPATSWSQENLCKK